MFSHWGLHGFAAPKYKSVEEGDGLCRRTFRVPATWRGQRVFVRFEGVQYGMTVWVNGTNVGERASGYNPVTFDVTDALRPAGAENVIAVRVTTRSKGWEFDTNDCWALSGIYREVTLFALPAVHLTDPSYAPIFLTHAQATVMRDKIRPSVIVWSVGNQNPITPIQLDTAREVKRLDPTRPICIPTVGPYFAQNWEKFPDFVDIYAPHYPSNARLREYAERLKRPVIVTEYAHRLGLASDRVQDQWDYMYQTPRLAGERYLPGDHRPGPVSLLGRARVSCGVPG